MATQHQEQNSGVSKEPESATKPDRHQSWVAVLLAGVGGSIDAIGYLMFAGLFMGFMSGNSISLGLNSSQQHWEKVAHAAFAILLFTLGVFVGALLPNKKMVLALCLEMALIATALCWQIWGNFSPTTSDALYFFPRVALLAGAMGIQAGTLRKVGTQSIHTTFVTGDLTSWASLLAAPFAKPSQSKNAQAAKSEVVERKNLLAGVWLVYVLGAAAGAAAFGYRPQEALLLPLFLLGIALVLSLLHRSEKTV